MTPYVRSALVALALALTGCAPLQPKDPDKGVAAAPAHRELLVLLHASPPHFRPEATYSAVYGVPSTSGTQRRIAEDLALRRHLVILDAWPMPSLSVDCFVMAAESAEEMMRAVAEIGRDPRVESAQPMNVFTVMGHNDPLYPLQPSAKMWHLEDLHRVATGMNVRIAVVDTGVERDHPDLRGRVAVARDFIDGRDPPPEAHGTAVAGIIAARADDGIGIAGVAPESRLYALRACRETASGLPATCTTFSLAKALQFAIDQDVQVVNLSLGGPDDRLLGRLIEAALASNIAVVAAADPRVNGGGFPASHPGVLAVAADSVPNLPPGAMLAPGHDVPTTVLGHAWGFVTGSSYSAAQVSGVVALLRERAPNLPVAQIRESLTPREATARHPQVDACYVLSGATHDCACGCLLGQGRPGREGR